MTTRDQFRLSKLLVGVVMLLSLLLGCSSQDQKANLSPRPVKVFRVGTTNTGSITTYAGDIRARFETTLSFRVPVQWKSLNEVT